MRDIFTAAWQKFGGLIVGLLPQSPTIDSNALRVIARYAAYVNYVFPVGKFLGFVALTLMAVGIYYGVMIILRMMRAIS